MPDNGELLRQIHATVIRTEQVTSRNSVDIKELRGKADSTLSKLSRLDERTGNHEKQIGELRGDAKRQGGLSGAASGGGIAGLLYLLKHMFGSNP